jgi:hypothetical protein
LTDPYFRTDPQSDPTFFFGRQKILDEIPQALQQGQHYAILGLRRVGKTSVLRQIENRLIRLPFASFEVFSHATANQLFTRVLKEFRERLLILDFRGVPAIGSITTENEFQEQFLQLYDFWAMASRPDPFILIIDEAERLFPSRDDPANETDLAETARFFRTVRALAQERHCLTLCMAAYRPNLNRWNRLGSRAGENAFFQQYREVFLGPLDVASTCAMLTKLGLLQRIEWTQEALTSTFEYSGGYPQLARFFASDITHHGEVKRVDITAVRNMASEIQQNFRRHRIFTFLRESIWSELKPAEKAILQSIVRGKGLQAADPDSLNDLELMGVVSKSNGDYHIASDLFYYWLEYNDI